MSIIHQLPPHEIVAEIFPALATDQVSTIDDHNHPDSTDMQNSTSTTSDSLDVEYLAHVILMPIVISIGFVGQMLNLITLHQPRLKGVTFQYLKAMAFAEFFAILALIPFVVRQAANSSLNFAPTGNSKQSCWRLFYTTHLEMPLINAFVAANSLCIVGLSVERYFHVCRPLWAHKAGGTPKKARVVIGCLYLVAFVMFIPAVFENRMEQRQPMATHHDGHVIGQQESHVTQQASTRIGQDSLMVLRMAERFVTDRSARSTVDRSRRVIDDPDLLIHHRSDPSIDISGQPLITRIDQLIDHESKRATVANHCDNWIVRRNHSLHEWTSFKIYLLLRESLVRIGPIVIVIILNVAIYRGYRRTSTKRKKLVSVKRFSYRRRSSRRKKPGFVKMGAGVGQADVELGSSVVPAPASGVGTKSAVKPPRTDRRASEPDPNDDSQSGISDDHRRSGSGARLGVGGEATAIQRSSSPCLGPGAEGEGALDQVSQSLLDSSDIGLEPDHASKRGPGPKRSFTFKSKLGFLNFASTTSSRSPSLSPRSAIEEPILSPSNGGSDPVDLEDPDLDQDADADPDDVPSPTTTRFATSTTTFNDNRTLAIKYRGTRREKNDQERQRRVYVLLIVTVSSYLICTLPAGVLSLVFLTSPTVEEDEARFRGWRTAANLFEAISFAVNFYIYCSCSEDYRKIFMKWIRRSIDRVHRFVYDQ